MGTTAKHQLPYPEPTDPVADGAAAMRALAEAVDPKLQLGQFISRTHTGLGFTTTSVAAQRVPELQILITPKSAASKFLLRASLMVGANPTADDVSFYFMNGIVAVPGSVSVGGSGLNTTRAHRFQGGSINAGGLEIAHINFEYLWAAATTAQLDLCIAMGVRTGGQQLFLNRRGADASVGGTSTFTVQEFV